MLLSFCAKCKTSFSKSSYEIELSFCTKASFILESKLNELVADISKLNKINEQLKLNMQLNEQKLGAIISSKLKLAKKYELKSSASSLRISNGRLRMKNMNLFARKQSFYSRVNSR